MTSPPIGGDVTRWDELHPAEIALVGRPYNSDGDWVLCRVADSAWKTGDRIQFSGITSLSQFSIGKGVHSRIEVSPDSVRFARTPSTVTIADSILISNKGIDTLIISGISHANPQFALSTTQMVILSGEQRYLSISYHPATDGWVYDTLHIASNDPDKPVANVTVRGQGFVIDTWPGSALLCEGTSKYVEVADNGTLDLTSNYTLEAWISPEGFDFLGGIISKYQQAGAMGYYLRLTIDPPYTGLNFDGLSTAQGILEPGRWFHVAAINNNGNRFLYVNGIPQTLSGTADVIETNNNPLTIGVDYLGDARYFNGKIDEVRIWNVARSEKEVRENMHLTLKGNEAGLVSYWQFNEGTGISAADKIHGNNGVLQNFSTSGWIESTIPAGGGTSFTNEVSTPGPVTFNGAGIDMNFTEKTGNDSIVVSRIDSTANINPVEIQDVFDSQYWVVHKYGSGTLNAGLTFTFTENLTSQDEIDPSNIKLYTRGSTADSSWAFLASAVSVNAATNQATFEGLSGFSQFIAGRAVQVPSNLTVANHYIHNNETECYDATNVITISDFFVETGGSATLIAGESIHFMPDLLVLPGGYLHGYITTTGNFCKSISPLIEVGSWKSAVDDRKLAVDSWFKLFPNPTLGVFTLELSGICGDEVQVTVYGMYGEMILQQKSVQQRRTTFYLEKEPAGIYIVRISSGVDTVFKKIVKL